MLRRKPAYRRSIWETDPRYALDSSLTESELVTISRLISVDAAKKNAPPIAARDLLDISQAASLMPLAKCVKSKDVEEYLNRGTKHLGAGIPTLVCMLAVESCGNYPPMDRKIASGLLKKGEICDDEKNTLTGVSVSEFAKVYVEKVLPVWRDTRETRSAREADDYWGRGGAD